MARANPNKTKYVRTILSVEEVNMLQATFKTNRPGSIRNRCIISTLFRTQIRISELTSLRVCDVDLPKGMIYVPFGKGDRSRIVGVPRTAIPLLRAWTAAREADLELKGFKSDWFFCNLRKGSVGGRMKKRKIATMLQAAKRKSGIKKRVHPHGFRHSGAFHLVDCGVDIRTIRQQLGHNSLKYTFMYCEGLNPKNMLDAIHTKARF